MKNWVFIIFLLMSVKPFYAYNQNIDTTIKGQKIPYIYMDGEAGYSNGLLLGIYGNISLINGWGVSVGYDNYYKESKEFPLNYDAGLCFDLSPDGCHPMDKVFAYNFRLSKRIDTKTQLIRFKGEIGLAMIQYQQIHFHSIGSNGSLLGSNYSKTYSTIYSNGASIRLVSEFPFSQIMGLQFSMLGIITKKKSFVGLELGMTVGYLRKKLINRKLKK